MTLLNIYEWITRNVSAAWNWLIHADLLVALKYIVIFALITVAIIFVTFISNLYNTALIAAYERFPGLMKKIYWSMLLVMLVSIISFILSLALSLAGVEVPDVALFSSLLITLLSLIAAMLIRKNENNA